MVGLVHDEVVLLVPEEHAGRAAGWLTEIMEGVGDVVVNGDAPPEKRVPLKADTTICRRDRGPDAASAGAPPPLRSCRRVAHTHWMPAMGRNTAEGMDEALG